MSASGSHDAPATWLRYGAAIAAVVVTALARAALQPVLGAGFAVLPFIPAVTLASWLGGLGPGLAATLLSIVTARALWLAPGPAGTRALLLFAVAGAAISGFSEALHRARRRETAGADAQRRARTASAHLAAIVESSDDAIVSKSVDGMIETWNRSAERIFGYTAAEAIGRPVSILIPPELAEEEAAILARVRRGEHVNHYETVRVCKDGRRIDVSLTVSPIRDGAGRVIGASKIARDVTGRKQAEQERERLLGLERAARVQAEALARAASLLIAPLDPDALAREIVDTVRALLGSQVAVCATLDPAGALLVRAVSGEGGPSWRAGAALPEGSEPMWHALREKRPVATANVLEDPAGRLRPEVRASLEAAPFRAALSVPLVIEDRVIGAIGIGDRAGRIFTEEEVRLVSAFAAQAAVATENARLYRAIEATSRAKDEFLAMLGHELRNPLGAISSALALLTRSAGADERTAMAQEIVTRQVRQLSRLVDDLLDVSRLASGKIALRRERVDIGELIDRCVLTLRAGGRLGDRRLAVSARPVVVEADPARLEQVLTNLLDNAIKYTPPAGAIEVGVEPVGAEAVLTVRDTGIGLAPDVLPTLFEPFTQVERSLDRTRGGLGLGLTLVKRLVELHDGRVSAASPGLGRGSEFTVRIPLAGPSARPAPPDAAPAACGKARRVLIVEDNPDVREALSIWLESRGHQVEATADGERGLALILGSRPDIALVDVGLPGLDGYAIARRIRATPGTESIRLVALTGYGQPEDRREAMEAGFDAHLVKPVDEAALLQLLVDRPMGAETA